MKKKIQKFLGRNKKRILTYSNYFLIGLMSVNIFFIEKIDIMILLFALIYLINKR